MRESDASFKDAKDAFSKAAYDMDQARRLLKKWKEDPEKRRAEQQAEIAWLINNEEYHKESLWEQFKREMDYANKRIRELEEKLDKLG